MEDELRRANHKVFKLKYHFVFCIKYRKEIFTEGKYVEAMKEICNGIGERYHMEFETLGFDKNHVHIMLKSAPKYSPSQLFRVVKSITAIRLFKKYPKIKEDLWGGEFWSDGGFVGTVGEGINGDIIRNYIEKQGKKADQLKLVHFE